MSLPVILTPSSLGPSPCYTGPNQEQLRFNDYVGHIQATLPANFTTVIVSSSAPGPDDRDKIWIQVDGSGRIISVNTFSNGQWQTINPTTPYLIPGEFREYDPALYTPIAPWFPCDGTVPNVRDRKGTFPVCIGMRTLPSGSTDTATNFVDGTTGGRETLILADSNIPAHLHTLTGIPGAGTANPNPTVLAVDNTAGSGFLPNPGFIRGGNTTGLAVDGITPNPPISASTLPPYFPVNYMQWRPDLV